MRAACRRPRGPRVLGLGGGSRLAAPGPAPPLLCLHSQLKFPFQAPPAQLAPVPDRALSLSRSVPVALPRTPTLPWAALLAPPQLRTGTKGPVTRAPGFSSFGGGRPRRAAGRKCRSLEPRGEDGPLPASAWFDAGWPEGLRDFRETALPRATPGPPPGRQNREGLVPGRWLHLIPHLLGSWRRKACSPTARPSLRPAPPPTSPAGGVAGSGGSGPLLSAAVLSCKPTLSTY